MPFVVPCPRCGTQLRSATQLPAGRRLNCPACDCSFTMRAPAEPVLIATGLKDRDGDDIPHAVVLDDEMGDDRAPVNRKRDDDRPHSGRRRDEWRRARGGTSIKKRSAPAVVVGSIMAVFAAFLVVGV